MPKFDKCFITGCDINTEWQLPWFLENYYKHNRDPLLVADFGMSERAKEALSIDIRISGIMHMDKIGETEKGWFYKPLTMLNSPSDKTVWIDTDCEIKQNLSSIWNLLQPNKLNMVEDKPWSKRRGETWHNSGVVGFIKKPEILKRWAAEVRTSPTVGDQEVLHSLLDPISRMTYINDLPNSFNWLRLQIDNDGSPPPDNVKIIHWTGEKGNNRIKGLIKINRFING